MNLSAIIEGQELGDKDEFNYMVRTTSSYFRVKNVDAFRMALQSWPHVRVKTPELTEWDDEVVLSAGGVEIETMESDLAYRFPHRKSEQISDTQVSWISTFDPDFLKAIQPHLRPLQTCTLYEISYDVDDGDMMRLAVVRDDGFISESNLTAVLCSMGVNNFPINRIAYPGDEEYPAGSEGPATLGP
jgi:hypothetical protein